MRRTPIRNGKRYPFKYALAVARLAKALTEDFVSNDRADYSCGEKCLLGIFLSVIANGVIAFRVSVRIGESPNRNIAENESTTIAGV